MNLMYVYMYIEITGAFWKPTWNESYKHMIDVGLIFSLVENTFI